MMDKDDKVLTMSRTKSTKPVDLGNIPSAPTKTLPPALAEQPQFTAEYWQKAPRTTAVGHIARVTNVAGPDDEPWVEIALKEGAQFRRKKSEIEQLLTANLEVHIEAIVTKGGELITGLFVPNCGWAFRMTAEDIASYAYQVSQEVHEQQQLMRERMVVSVANLIGGHLANIGIIRPYTDDPNEELTEDSMRKGVVYVAGTLDVVLMSRTLITQMEAVTNGPQ